MESYELYKQYSTEDFASEDQVIAWVLTPTDQLDAYWQTFMMLYPHKRKTLLDARQLIIASKQHFAPPHLSEDERREMLSSIHQKITTSTHAYTWKRWVARVAAGLALLLAIGWGWQYWSNTKKEQWITIRDTSQKIFLPDSSWVLLNENAVISYRQNWDQQREVWLEGEAFFDIKKATTKRKTFKVHTDDLTVEVLGTLFNVNSRVDETHVVLEEGEIRLDFKKNKKPAMLLKPGDKVVYSLETNHLTKKVVNPKVFTSWKDGVLLLEEVTLEDASVLIEDNFDLVLVIEDETLRSQEIQGAVPLNNKKVLLETLSTLFKVQLSTTNDTLWLSK